MPCYRGDEFTQSGAQKLNWSKFTERVWSGLRDNNSVVHDFLKSHFEAANFPAGHEESGRYFVALFMNDLGKLPCLASSTTEYQSVAQMLNADLDRSPQGKLRILREAELYMSTHMSGFYDQLQLYLLEYGEQYRWETENRFTHQVMVLARLVVTLLRYHAERDNMTATLTEILGTPRSDP